jgi:flagellar motility protein MotE (MotC chaperone)
LVVMAAGALLVFKTFGLVTQGSYVLPGPTQVFAAGAAPPAEGAGEGGAGGDTIVLPSDPTIEDLSPTLSDELPEFEGPDVAGDHSTDAGAAEGGHAEAEAGDHADQPAEEAAALVTEECLVLIGEEPAADGEAAAGAEDCVPRADAVPMQMGADGQPVPVVSAGSGSLTETALLERLAARRDELDARADELDLREALITAAERRVEERAATMEQLESQIASLVDQREAAEEGLVAGVVSMYETMRPRDAATIFNELDMEVLLQVARAMSPRKMAPILAEMTPARAQELTVRLAAVDSSPLVPDVGSLSSELPQIVGQ